MWAFIRSANPLYAISLQPLSKSNPIVAISSWQSLTPVERKSRLSVTNRSWGTILQPSTVAITKFVSRTRTLSKSSDTHSLSRQASRLWTTLTLSRRSTWGQLSCKPRRLRTWSSSWGRSSLCLSSVKRTSSHRTSWSRAELSHSVSFQSLSCSCRPTCRLPTWRTSSATRKSSERETTSWRCVSDGTLQHQAPAWNPKKSKASKHSFI